MPWSKLLAATAVALLSCLAPVAAAQAEAYPAPPPLKATTACVIDADSGQMLWGWNEHARRPMASTTKIMTTLLACESGKLDDVVTISKRAASVGEASIYLQAGEKLTLRQLVYGALLASGNDAAWAIAEYVGGGDVNKFIGMMNQRAQELGLKDTHYNSPNGLPTPDHYSSSYDLCALLRVASQDPDWEQIATTKFKKLPYCGKPDGRVLRNHNRLLWTYPYAGGGKTGYTDKAGPCFTGTANKGDRHVVEAVMDDLQMWADSQKLLAYGLNNFDKVVVARKGEVVGTVPIQSGYNRVVEVVAPQDVSVTLPRGTAEKASLQQVWQLPDQMSAPINQNQQVGQLVVRDGNQVLTKVPLVAAEAVPVAASPWAHISSWFFPGMLAASLLSLLRLQNVRRRRKRRRLRRVPGTMVAKQGTGRLSKAS
ncbi:MAG TPA: D-alanyl-D-alanine carboxypeptidase family protein [Oscillatoriaceae cyanobacterium]